MRLHLDPRSGATDIESVASLLEKCDFIRELDKPVLDIYNPLSYSATRRPNLQSARRRIRVKIVKILRNFGSCNDLRSYTAPGSRSFHDFIYELIYFSHSTNTSQCWFSAPSTRFSIHTRAHILGEIFFLSLGLCTRWLGSNTYTSRSLSVKRIFTPRRKPIGTEAVQFHPTFAIIRRTCCASNDC